ncbi:MAG: tyrosine-type recombinase/integrase [Anaerostipes sp.]|nr:tyrosine-type recombinase/integrase [Anaerostipes sp.]
MRTLNQFLRFIETGEIYTAVTGRHDHKSSMDLLPDWCRRKLMDFLELRRLEGMEKSTLTMYRSSIVRFCTYLISQSISDFNNVMPKTLQDFNAADRHSSTEGKSAYNSRIRNFILYLNDINVIENHLLYKALPTITAPKTRIVNVLGNDEIESIATYGTEHDSPIALRDYAMIVIGLKMGLRASDIVALTFKDVNWKNKSISIIQKKTGKALMLPLPVNVGNAIYKYIKYGRPESEDIHIFINHCAPYGRLGTSVCGSALKRILPDRNQPGSGFHVVRKTFATNLLRGNSRISLISDTLGHRTDGTVHKYLSLDEERMTECPLSLNIAGIAWAGGDF